MQDHSNLHVLHVVRDLDRTSGGPSRSVPALASHLAACDHMQRVSLVYQDRGAATTIDDYYQTTNLDAFGVAKPAVGWSHMRRQVAEINDRLPIDVIHLHGIWSPTLHAVAKFARQCRIPYVVAPRGMLSQWCIGSKSIRKKLAWTLYQSRDLQNASRIHVTSQAEANDVAELGVRPHCQIIPNGCELPTEEGGRTEGVQIEGSMLPAEGRWAVSIGRIHPVKGFAELVDAWHRVQPQGWRLLIAGPDEVGYFAQLKERIDALGLSDSIVIRGAVSNDEKWQLLAQAELFLLASHSENFGIVIAEALASATPVVATQGTPWQELDSNRCGWWVPTTPDGLAGGLSEAVETSASELALMGDRGRRLILENYAWQQQAIKTVQMYRRILENESSRRVH